MVPWLPPVPGAREYYGFREAGARVTAEMTAMGGGRAVIAAHRYQVAAQLAYHTGDTVPVVLLPSPDPASIWPAPARYRGADAVAISYAPESFAWERCFRRSEEQAPLVIRLKGEPIQAFRVFRLYGLMASCEP
jgi:hypothetical protein